MIIFPQLHMAGVFDLRAVFFCDDSHYWRAPFQIFISSEHFHNVMKCFNRKWLSSLFKKRRIIAFTKSIFITTVFPKVMQLYNTIMKPNEYGSKWKWVQMNMKIWKWICVQFQYRDNFIISINNLATTFKSVIDLNFK